MLPAVICRNQAPIFECHPVGVFFSWKIVKVRPKNSEHLKLAHDQILVGDFILKI